MEGRPSPGGEVWVEYGKGGKGWELREGTSGGGMFRAMGSRGTKAAGGVKVILVLLSKGGRAPQA